MKRSEINQCIQEAKEVFAKYSFRLPPWAYFSPDEWAQKGDAYDDNTDNRFYEPVGRFPAIEEDEAPLHLLCNEYPKPGRPEK